MAEVGASNSQVNSGTVLFVFRASRFIRRRLNQQAGIGLTQRPQADVRLPQTYSFLSSTDSPWNYDSMVNQPGFVSSLISASTLYT
ncbi:MAG: hypothetical protein F6J98_45395 [Moorea sp. SIO4G2]|nr:hypothetical protein [Moorena sp. SIO4G2]